MSAYLCLREYERAWLGDEEVQTGSFDGEKRVISARHLRWLERFESSQAEEIFRWGRRWVGASQWVGMVQVRDLVVEILPKIDGDDERSTLWRGNLLFMLSLVGELPFRPREFAKQAVEEGPLLEVLVGLFAEALSEELKKGRHQYYVEQQQNLPVLKGKLRFSQHIAQNMARKDRFFVEYQELLPDTAINQIFKATCERLMRLSDVYRNKERLRFCLLMLQGVRSRRIGGDDFERVVKNRQNERFLSLLAICRLFWEGLLPAGRRGERENFALLYDMNVLFERFIAEFVRRYVVSRLGEEVSLHVQGSEVERHLLWRDVAGEKGTVRLLPDLMIRRGGETVVVDTKWKRLEGIRAGRQGVVAADLYQAFAYAKRFEARRVVLLYPWVKGGKEQVFFVPWEDGSTVEVRFVRLDRDLTSREGLAQVIDDMKRMIWDER